MITGTELSPEERRFRSSIAQLATGTWFLRGTAIEPVRDTAGTPLTPTPAECLMLLARLEAAGLLRLGDWKLASPLISSMLSGCAI
jgi:hypothetical protein